MGLFAAPMKCRIWWLSSVTLLYWGTRTTVELRDGWRRHDLTDLEEERFQDRAMPSQQALRRAIRDTTDMLTGTNFPVKHMGERRT